MTDNIKHNESERQMGSQRTQEGENTREITRDRYSYLLTNNNWIQAL